MNLNSYLKFIKEFLIGILEFVISNIESKIGFAFLFLIIGVVFLLPRDGDVKYFFTAVGILSLVNSIRLFASRIKEIKNEKNNLTRKK